MIDFNALQMFATIVECHSFSKAAKVLDVPPSTISRKMKELEAHLGIKLLERTTRSLRLTSAGELWFKTIQTSLLEINNTIKKTHSIKEEIAGTIRITSTLIDSSTVIPQLLTAFRKKYPKVNFYLWASKEMIDLTEGKVDVAFRVAQKLKDSSYKVKLLANFKYIFVASPQYVHSAKKLNTAKDLEKHDLILRKGNVKANKKLKVFSDEGPEVISPPVGVVTSDHSGALALALSGAGITQLPELEIRGFLKSGELIHVLPQYWVKESNLFVLHSFDRTQPAYLRCFLDFCYEYFSS